MNKSSQVSTMNPENLLDLFYKDQPVITTESLSVIYDTEPVRILQNFQRTKDRFEETKHFFRLEGRELKDFKNCLSKSEVVSISPHTKHFLLWTERGAARHAKMLNTDQAWNVFEKLEDAYFNRVPYSIVKGSGAASKEQKLTRIASVFSTAKKLSREAGLMGDEAILKANEITVQTIGVDVFNSFKIDKPKVKLDAEDYPEDVKVFFENLDSMLASGEVQDHDNKLDIAWIHMPSALDEIEKIIGRSFNRGVLYHQIKKSDRYVDQKDALRSKVFKKPIRAWGFSKIIASGEVN